MEGYSVTEAAAVLGVPTERVWELLARGVLAGHADGESGMRVFLQPRASAPASRMEMPPPTPQPAREPERELSPFRELLTEFRNLTERYGQALLALGEARGEVASLRSRVDLLEARMDLRLPMGPPALTPPIGWDAPEPGRRSEPLEPPDTEPSRVAEPPLEAEPRETEPRETEPRETEPSETAELRRETAELRRETAEPRRETDVVGVAPPAPLDADEAEEPHRRRRTHHATESFAEALARAEDPTVPELPEPTRETVPHAFEHESVSAAIDAGLPRELPVAEPMPTVDEAPSGVTVEPPATDEAPEAGAQAVPEAEAAQVAEPALALETELAASVPTRSAEVWEPREPVSPVADVAPVDEDHLAVDELEAWASDDLPGVANAEPAMPGAPMDVEDIPPVEESVGKGEPAEPEPQRADGPAEPEPQRADGPAEPEPERADGPAEPEPERADEPASPLAWDPERYTTAIEEPDWYAEEAVPPAAPVPATEQRLEEATEVEAEPIADQSEPIADQSEPVTDEGTRAPFEMEGAGEMEAPPSAHATQPEPDANAASGDPLAALDALARSAAQPGSASPGPWSGTPVRREGPHTAPIDPASVYRQSLIGRPVPAPTPASRAYRRLRRIFPG